MNSKQVSKAKKWGAEAILIKDVFFGFNVLKKIRVKKDYRIPEIDEKLRKSRTAVEAKLLIDAKKAGVKTPIVFVIDLENTTIVMEEITGKTIKSYLESTENSTKKNLTMKRIGENIGILHKNNVIHGDLTTSNIILQKDNLYFIDFGLGKISRAIEDKAVDLLLMKKCLVSTHTSHANDYFRSFQQGYQALNPKAKTIFKRAITVEARARHLSKEEIKQKYFIE